MKITLHTASCAALPPPPPSPFSPPSEAQSESDLLACRGKKSTCQASCVSEEEVRMIEEPPPTRGSRRIPLIPTAIWLLFYFLFFGGIKARLT